MARKLHCELSDIEQRLLRANEPLAEELLRRGIVSQPRYEALGQHLRLAGALLASELANADRQLAARAVLRGLLSREELKCLDTMLKFQPRAKRTEKLDELVRIVERALGGDDGAGGGCHVNGG